MLIFVIVAQGILFYILDRNSEEQVYTEKGFKGFMMVIMDSYKLAVGDFEPVQEAFVDNTEYEVYFWIIFFLGTILSLILLLNMVIAVMSMSLENVVND